MGLRTALPTQANVPFNANRQPAAVAKIIGTPRRLARKYVEKPAINSRQMWNQSRPAGKANNKVSGKNDAACISPASGWPSPS